MASEKKLSTLNKQSSLLAIYSLLHYMTVPLACQHLHIAVTSLRALLIINGSHMLRGVPYYRVITATQKNKKNVNDVDMKYNTKVSELLMASLTNICRAWVLAVF